MRCAGPVDATMAAVISQAMVLCKDPRLNSHTQARLQVLSAVGHLAAGSADEAVRRKLVDVLLAQTPAGSLAPSGPLQVASVQGRTALGLYQLNRRDVITPLCNPLW
jgi:hypothetical protein